MLSSIQMSEDIKNENHIIEDPDVANVVAYATYPNEDTAHTLEKHGFDDLAVEQRARIDGISLAALQAWVQEAKHDEYLNSGDPQETERRRLAVEAASSNFSIAHLASEAGEIKEPPQLKGVGEEFTARVVGYMLTHNPNEPMFMRQLADDLGGENQSKISKTIGQLTDMGYVVQQEAHNYGRRPYKNLFPTDKLQSDAEAIPLWRDQVELFELAKQFGLSDIETKRYLAKLGGAMFLKKN